MAIGLGAFFLATLSLVLAVRTTKAVWLLIFVALASLGYVVGIQAIIDSS